LCVEGSDITNKGENQKSERINSALKEGGRGREGGREGGEESEQKGREDGR